jgi:hypothetical protein
MLIIDWLPCSLTCGSVTLTSVVIINSELLTMVYIDSDMSINNGLTICVLAENIPTMTKIQCEYPSHRAI